MVTRPQMRRNQKPQVMHKPTRHLLQDSQEFIDSIIKFGQNTEEEKEEEKEEEIALIPSFEITLPNPTTDTWPFKPKNIRHDLITFVEHFYFTYKSLPNKADFETRFNKHDLPQDLEGWKILLVELQEPLQARGIQPYETPSDYLEPNFVLAVNLVINAYDKRSIPAKLKEAGLTTKQWTAMLRKPKQYEYYQSRLNTIFDEDTQNDAKLALQRLISNGDLQAIKHFHELQNIYRPQANFNELVSKLLITIMDILAKHVTPEVLGRVANEISKANVIESKAS